MTFCKILLEHPATPRRLAWRICQTFMGEGVVDDAALAELAEACAPMGSISAGRSKRSCDRSCFSRPRICVAAWPDRSSTSSAPASARIDRSAPQHAAVGRMGRADGPGFVLSAQRRRLERRPGVAFVALDRGPGEFCRCAGHGRAVESDAAGPRSKNCRPACQSGRS